MEGERALICRKTRRQAEVRRRRGRGEVEARQRPYKCSVGARQKPVVALMPHSHRVTLAPQDSARNHRAHKLQRSCGVGLARVSWTLKCRKGSVCLCLTSKLNKSDSAPVGWSWSTDALW